jgi:hypothetical protein
VRVIGAVGYRREHIVDFFDEFRIPGHIEIDAVRFAQVMGFEPSGLAKLARAGGAESAELTDARLQSFLRDSLRDFQPPTRLPEIVIALSSGFAAQLFLSLQTEP